MLSLVVDEDIVFLRACHLRKRTAYAVGYFPDGPAG